MVMLLNNKNGFLPLNQGTYTNLLQELDETTDVFEREGMMFIQQTENKERNILRRLFANVHGETCSIMIVNRTMEV